MEFVIDALELLTEDEQLVSDGVRRVCGRFDDQYWAACDEQHRFPWEFYEALAEGGWLGIAMPPEHGGGGLGIASAAVMMREIARSGAAMNGCSAVHLTIFGLNPVVRFGSEALKKQFLGPAARGEIHVAFGVTEPDAGTDTSRISTRARQTQGGYLIRGRKIWTTKALESQVVLLLARTADTSRGLEGLTLFLADLDRRSVQISPIEKLGRNAVASCEVVYDDLFVSQDRVVGEVGKGFAALLHSLNPERILLSAEAIGIGEVAIGHAVSYARNREVFGRPIGSNQAVSHPLARAYSQLYAAWKVTLDAARRYDAGQDVGGPANIAKFLAAEAGFLAADQAVQTLGGMGYAREYHVERYFREARLLRLAPVTQEMTLNYLAHNHLDLPRSY